MLVIALLLPLWIRSPYLIHVFNLTLLYIIAASSLRPIDVSGQLSLGHAGFMAVGVQGQKIMIIPSKDLVIVKVAATGSEHPDLDLKRFLTLTLDAIRE